MGNFFKFLRLLSLADRGVRFLESPRVGAGVTWLLGPVCLVVTLPVGPAATQRPLLQLFCLQIPLLISEYKHH